MKFISSFFICAVMLLLPLTSFAFIQSNETGFLTIAPDRGFMGNQEIREAHKKFAEKYRSSLVFVTPEETERFLEEGIDQLKEDGAEKLVVIPMFLSDDHPLYKLALGHLSNQQFTGLPVEVAPTMSHSYLTAEILADRISELSTNPEEEGLVVVASGASTDQEREGVKGDIEQLLEMNQGRFSFANQAIVIYGNDAGRSETADQELENTLVSMKEAGLKPVVVPFDLTQKLDGMMAFSSRIRSTVTGQGAAFNGKDITPHKNTELWLAKQANSYLPVTKENLGVVFMPHGSNYNWNRTMMDAIEELQDEYMIEFAFSMGDPVLINNAVQRLEERGATAVTVLRIFSLESSFKAATEYTLGLRPNMGHDGMMHGMGGMPPRVQSGSVFYTTGGLEDSPLFAEALLDRAIGLSENPEKETVILVGHGTRTEEGNAHWLKNLESITAHMEKTAEEKNYNFRDFKFENWREDWPDLRDEHIENVRNMVKEAGEDGGSAIVIPARTTQGGHAERWLGDLEFKHNGEGFAPHPLFVEWVEGLIQESMTYFNEGQTGKASEATQVSSQIDDHSH